MAILSMTSCQEDKNQIVPVTNVTTTIQVQQQQWSYLNLQKGLVVGTSPLGDTAADQQWYSRTDWDIAFCGDMIRTNGGTSGSGQGSIQVINQPFDAVLEAPADDYITDRDDIEVW